LLCDLRTIADIFVASIQAMLPVSGNAHAAPSAAADSHDDDFQAVLASYVNDAKGTQDIAPNDVQAVKAGILEIADRFCGPGEANCGACPLKRLCVHSKKALEGQGDLFQG